jgi:enoyl reductase-like protein
MDSMLGEMGDDVFRLKTKFAKFARELQEEDERSQAVKLVNNRRTGYSKQGD